MKYISPKMSEKITHWARCLGHRERKETEIMVRKSMLRALVVRGRQEIDVNDELRIAGTEVCMRYIT